MTNERTAVQPAAQINVTALDTRRLDWLDQHCAFVADEEYNIGPFAIGELRQLADAGLAADWVTAKINAVGQVGVSEDQVLPVSDDRNPQLVPAAPTLTREQINYWREQLLKIEWSSPQWDIPQINALCDLALRALDSGQREQQQEALRIIAGEKQCVDNLMSNVDVAREALREYESPPPQDLIATRPDASLIAERPSPASGGDLDALVKRLRLRSKYEDRYDGKGVYRKWIGTGITPEHEAADAIERLVRERDAAERDAARYRRLRENWINCDELQLYGRLSVIDTSVDEAMRK